MVDRLVAVDDADYLLPDPVLAALATDMGDDDGALGTVFATAAQSKPRGIFLDVTKFGADPLGVIDSTAAIQAAYDEAASVALTPGLGGSGLDALGCTVFFPAGHYKTSAPLAAKSNVVTRGAGKRSARIFNNTSALYAWSGQIQRVNWEHIFLTTGASGGHIFDMGTDGAIALANFNSVAMFARNPTSALWKQRGTGRSFIEFRMDSCELDRIGGVGVGPAWDISMNGNYANNITFSNSWAHGHNATGAPFFRIESTDAWNYSISFRDITGEQNGGGLVHLLNANGVVVDNCVDWDFAGEYQGSVFLFGGASGCRGVTIKHSKRIKGGTLATLVYDIDASAAANRQITIEDCDFWNGVQGKFNLTSYSELVGLTGSATPEGAVAAPPGSVYTRTSGGGGLPLKYVKRAGVGSTGWVPQGTIAQAYSNKTGNYTATIDDDVLVFNGTSLTATLPAGGTMGLGRKVTIKNINASALTVATSPGLVDGAASVSLAQWQAKTFITDGSNSWLSL